MLPSVAIAKDADQRAAAHKALDLERGTIIAALERWEQSAGKKQILIKPNLLSTDINTACNTSVETCLGIADFFDELTGYKVFIGDGTTYESSHKPSTMLALNNHGYTAHDARWNLVDLHAGGTGKWFPTINHETPEPIELGIASMAVESFVVSVAKFKTHDVLGLTLCIKNMMGTLNSARYRVGGNTISRGDVKGYMHGFGSKKPNQLTRAQNTGPSKVALAANLVRLVTCRAPDLSVIDGSTVMEGSGPRRGNTCTGLGEFALAGTDPVAVDATCAVIAGMPLDSFQYVLRAGQRGIGTHDISKIDYKGFGWQSLYFPLKRHPLFAEASPWKVSEIDDLRAYTEP